MLFDLSGDEPVRDYRRVRRAKTLCVAGGEQLHRALTRPCLQIRSAGADQSESVKSNGCASKVSAFDLAKPNHEVLLHLVNRGSDVRCPLLYLLVELS